MPVSAVDPVSSQASSRKKTEAAPVLMKNPKQILHTRQQGSQQLEASGELEIAAVDNIKTPKGGNDSAGPKKRINISIDLDENKSAR